VDADVLLAPDAIAAAVGLLDGVDLVLTVSTAARIQRRRAPGTAAAARGRWLTFLPTRAMERSRRPSLAAAGGQFLVVTRPGYLRAGGHSSVRADVLEDIGARSRRSSGTGGRVRLAGRFPLRVMSHVWLVEPASRRLPEVAVGRVWLAADGRRGDGPCCCFCSWRRQ
jgi:hypothetical protein